LSTAPVSPSVTVVMPTFNRRSYLTRMLGPLLAEPDALEIVVVVDGCRDGSIELLETLAAREPRVRPVSIENSGMGEARMAGARVARGEVVLLLDDDVLVAPGTVHGHARAHAAGEHLVVVGAMPVSGGSQSDARDYARVMYANEYRRHCERWLAHPETILTTLWAGHLSLRRADLLALKPPSLPELGRGYHSDIDFGLRCERAGLRGIYNPNLRAEHLYHRDPQAFVRDARDSGRSLLLLHQEHQVELGPITERELLGGLFLPLRTVVRLSLNRDWPVRITEIATSALGAMHLYRVQRGAAQVRKRIEQVREIGAVAQPARVAGVVDREDSAPSAVPRIAVIVPCFNDGPLAQQALASLAAQEAAEVVVIDDASSEPATLQALEALRREGIHVIRHEVNLGLSGARMTGLRATAARFVFPLDSDDLLVPGALRALADVLEHDPRVAVAFGDYEEFGERSRTCRVPQSLDAFRIAYRNEYPVSSMFRREALSRVGGWRDVGGLVGYEDWHLWMSLAEHGERGVHVGPGQVVLRRRIGASRMLGDAGSRHRELYGHLRRLHPRLFSEIAAHRARTDLPLTGRWLYPILYGGRPPLGLWSRVISASAARARRARG
jgi:glycosyltransferase involved in cell wall biosynthesis